MPPFSGGDVSGTFNYLKLWSIGERWHNTQVSKDSGKGKEETVFRKENHGGAKGILVLTNTKALHRHPVYERMKEGIKGGSLGPPLCPSV